MHRIHFRSTMATGAAALLLMTREDYDSACPLTVRPAPTQTARVGLVLTEFAARSKRVSLTNVASKWRLLLL